MVFTNSLRHLVYCFYFAVAKVTTEAAEGRSSLSGLLGQGNQ